MEVYMMQVLDHAQVEWLCVAPHVAATFQSLLREAGYNKEVQWWVSGTNCNSPGHRPAPGQKSH